MYVNTVDSLHHDHRNGDNTTDIAGLQVPARIAKTRHQQQINAPFCITNSVSRHYEFQSFGLTWFCAVGGTDLVGCSVWTMSLADYPVGIET
jgi:hypothetical protein